MWSSLAVLVCCALLGPCSAQEHAFSQVPQFSFPNQPRTIPRQLSLQQQTQILSDVHQHHRFTPLNLPANNQPSLYTHEEEFQAPTPTVQAVERSTQVFLPTPHHPKYVETNRQGPPTTAQTFHVFNPPRVNQYPEERAQPSESDEDDDRQTNPRYYNAPQYQITSVKTSFSTSTSQRRPNAVQKVPSKPAETYTNVQQHKSSTNEQNVAEESERNEHVQLPTLTFSSVPKQSQQSNQQNQLQEQLQKQFQQQLLQRQELIRKLKYALVNSDNPEVPADLAQLLPNLQNQQFIAAQTSPPTTTAATPVTAAPTTVPPKVLFEQLTQGVLPPGADYEVIKHNQGGELEEVGRIPQDLPNKKVTFVFLEEQPDGSVKVKGVKGNAESAEKKEDPEIDVDSLIKKIQQGEIKLPPSTKLSGPQQNVIPSPSTQQTLISRSSVDVPVTINPSNYLQISNIQNNVKQQPTRNVAVSKPNEPDVQIQQSVSQEMEFFQGNSKSSTFAPTFQDIHQISSPSSPSPPLIGNSVYSVEAKPQLLNQETVFQPAATLHSQPPIQNQVSPNFGVNVQTHQQANTLPIYNPSTHQTPQFVPQGTPQIYSSTETPTTLSTTPFPQVQFAPPSNAAGQFTPSDVQTVDQLQNAHVQFNQPPPVQVKLHASLGQRSQVSKDRGQPAKTRTRGTVRASTPRSVLPPPTRRNPVLKATASQQQPQLEEPKTLSQVLKNNGLYAMAKFLRDSALDSILNDTGPYTVFAPTDKAFKALMVQLGGPDKAEEKFKENPRLLSGLLLHHVIPGAFPVSSLQDEMTGVSLAGTQLRVNTYTAQDIQWNDVQVTTINGARIEPSLKDVAVPMGVAHAVDRVMFPLPVGDVLQTLASDRDARFTKFLQAVHTAGMDSVLSGGRTYTVFAPTDMAWAALGAEGQRILTDAAASRALVERHVVSGAVYTAGMRYYQERPTLAAAAPVTIIKDDGQLKVNNARIISHNIPATNGVVHAVDALL